MKAKVAKHKIAPPFRIAEVDSLFGQEISRLGCIVGPAEQTGMIKRKES